MMPLHLKRINIPLVWLYTLEDEGQAPLVISFPKYAPFKKYYIVVHSHREALWREARR